MRWTDALKVGCAQALALVPGTSRSGATIIGGMLFGLSRVAATEFSFFLAIPTLFAATGYSLWKDRDAARRAGAAGVRRRLRRGVRLGVRLRALADPLREPSRLRAVRVVPDRVRRGDPRHRVRRARAVGLTDAPRAARWVGPLCAVLGVLGFSFKAILIKLAYAWHPIDAVTLLALRMLFSAPFFVAMAWWAARAAAARAARRAATGRALAWLGFIGYYLASLLDFMGLAVHHRGARAARAVPLSDDGRAAVGAAAAASRSRAAPSLALLLSYAGIALVFAHDLRRRRRSRAPC